MKLSIKHKIIGGQIFIFLLGFLILSLIINMVVSINNRNIVTRDMKNLKRNMEIYIEQYTYIYNDFYREEDFIYGADKLRDYLIDSTGRNLCFYALSGRRLDLEGDNIKNNEELVQSAMNGGATFTITPSNEGTKVVFAYPINIKGSRLGIIGIEEDYSNLYKDSRRLMELIEISILGVFIVLFIFSLITSNKIVRPLMEFSNFSKEIQKGNYEEKLTYNSKDEIGELSSNLNNMCKKIKEQIEVIKKDRDALKELDEYRKMFLDNVTHELKTPLTIIMGYGQALLDDGIENKDFFSKAAGYICNESTRLNKMVVQLLELSFQNKEELYEKFEKVNLSELVLNVSESMRLKSNRYSCKIITNIKANLCIMGMRDKLKQIIINLLDNSIKYSKRNCKIKVVLKDEEKNITLIIADEGIGISKENLENIFEPFCRGDKRKARELGSNGLGLSIVKAIVNKHNGKIDIESEEEKGTTVKISFPKDY